MRITVIINEHLTNSLSIVIPVYNSEKIILELVRQLENILPALSKNYELILVNDASQDNSWETIQALVKKYSWIHGICLMRNYGQHNALLCGIRAAQYDITITLDDDLQHPPSEIVKLLEKLDEGYDVVYGTPQKEQHGFWRNIASQITKLALKKSMGVEVARHISAFRVFRTDIRNAFSNYQNPMVSIDVLLTWGTTKFAAVVVEHRERHSGLSNYTIKKLISHALNMMTGFSTWPLQLASVLGFTFTLFGIGVFCYVIGRYFIQGSTVAGFPFLASIIAIFSGTQLFTIGIIGEYLARMYLRSIDKPVYTIRDSCTPIQIAHTYKEKTKFSEQLIRK